MGGSNGDVVNFPQSERPSPPRFQRVQSNTFKRPCLDLLDETSVEARLKYLELCVPLYKYASEGKWEKAKPMLLKHEILLKAGIAQGWPTVLHVAAGAGHIHFVKGLLNMMNESHLDLQDKRGNTALSFAAIAGNLDIAKLLCEKNRFLPKIRSGTGFTPLLFAALQGKDDVAKYLFPLTAEDDSFEEVEWNKTFLTCIDSGIYDLALEMLRERPSLAFARDEDNMTGLHIMAQKTADLGSDCPEYQNQFLTSGTKRSVALQLVRLLWEGILMGVGSRSDIREIINEPSRLIIDATKVGNFDFLAELMKAYPDLIWELDERRLTVIHIAVLHRYPKIFSLIHAYRASKDVILSYEDEKDGNNILHLAAKLAPPHRLELVSGAAFQMKLELLWFQEVKKIVQPSFVNKKNSNGETPQELFTKEHAALRKDAESWMLKTANSCIVVSTLVAIGVFLAAFSIPGGTNDDSGTPNYLRKRSFMTFAISDAIALISSSASILIFLSILISSCYSENDFYKSLPSRLILGLILLFVSITSMMIAFSCAFFVTFDRGLKWVPTFISVLSFFPLAIFLFSQFQLFYHIVYSTYYLRSLFKPGNHILYQEK